MVFLVWSSLLVSSWCGPGAVPFWCVVGAVLVQCWCVSGAMLVLFSLLVRSQCGVDLVGGAVGVVELGRFRFLLGVAFASIMFCCGPSCGDFWVR